MWWPSPLASEPGDKLCDSGFFICPHLVRTYPRPLAWLRRAIESQPSSPEAELNSTNWPFQNPQNPPHALPVHDVIHINWSTFLSDFHLNIYERHILPARALKPALKFAPN